MTYDIIIRGGSIVDGTGSEPVKGDVAIKDGLIAAIGTVEGDSKHCDRREAFSESDLPFRTDIVDRSSITPAFYAEISKDAIELAF